MKTTTALILFGVPLVAAAGAFAQPGAAPPPPPPNSATPPQPVLARRTGPSLAIGSPAPAFSGLAWARGGPVERLEPGRVWVVEFWRPSDPASRRALPLLSELQSLYQARGVGVVGVAVPEGGGPEVLRAFLEKQAAQINFPVAYDAQQSTAKAFMEASGQDALPTAFVVDAQGRVAWIGHPLDGLDRVLAKVVAGTFDLNAAAAEARAQADADARAAPLAARLERQFASGDQAAALKTMDDLVALDPKRLGDWALQKFAMLLMGMNDPDRAYAYAREQAAGRLKDTPQVLQAMAWMILTELGVPRRDTELARTLALQASELTNRADPVVEDTLAKAQFMTGRTEDAIATQAQAVRLAELPSMKAEYQKRLDEYTAARK